MNTLELSPLNPFKAYLINYIKECLNIFRDVKETHQAIKYIQVSEGALELQTINDVYMKFDKSIFVSGKMIHCQYFTEMNFIAKEENLREVLNLLEHENVKFYAIHCGNTLEIYCTKPHALKAGNSGTIMLNKKFKPIEPIELTEETVNSLIGKINDIVFLPENEIVFNQTILTLKNLIKPLGVKNMGVNFTQQI